MINALWMHLVVCDGCGDVLSDGGGDLWFCSSEQARAEAVLYGWRRAGGRDLCLVCAGDPTEPIPFVLVDAGVPS